MSAVENFRNRDRIGCVSSAIHTRDIDQRFLRTHSWEFASLLKDRCHFSDTKVLAQRECRAIEDAQCAMQDDFLSFTRAEREAVNLVLLSRYSKS